MAELDEVGVTDGVPTSGTGEVPTLAPVRDAILDLVAGMFAAGQTTMAASLPVAIASNQSAVAVVPTGATTGGLTIFRSLDLDETEEQVKGTAGQIYGGWVCNRSTAVLYLKFYNDTAANVVVGTTVPVLTVPIPGNATDDTMAILGLGGHGIAFSTAITVAVTTGLADNDTGAPGANDFIANLFYT